MENKPKETNKTRFRKLVPGNFEEAAKIVARRLGEIGVEGTEQIRLEEARQILWLTGTDHLYQFAEGMAKDIEELQLKIYNFEHNEI